MSSQTAVLAYPTVAAGAALLVYSLQTVAVGRARRRYGVPPPRTTGNEQFERVFRTQQNTLESLAIFIPSVYAFSYFVHPPTAGILGGLYALGRLAYGCTYSSSNPGRRVPGFFVTLLLNHVLLLGAMGGALYSLYHHQ